MDCSWADQAMLADTTIGRLSGHVLWSLRRNDMSDLHLQCLSKEALNPRCTDIIFAYYEPVFTDLCARWIGPGVTTGHKPVEVMSAFARILPFAPYLTSFAEYALYNHGFRERIVDDGHDAFLSLSSKYQTTPGDCQSTRLQDALLSALRLLSFDFSTFKKAISPVRVRQLFSHPNRVVKYLSIRLFCLLTQSADAASQKLVQKYFGEEPVNGQWENKHINYRFLSLWEEKRARNMLSELTRKHQLRSSYPLEKRKRPIVRSDLASWTAEISGVLLPRLGGGPAPLPSLVFTPTTAQNARVLADALKSSAPILLTGLPGSGKTALITHAAQETGVHKMLLTLHLNEQTDAKSLLGMHVSGGAPGSFSWQYGVLSRAVREGRWVLIEDIDRAPTDVLGVIQPLLSRRQLLISARNETIRAAQGFRLFATLRTSFNSQGEEHTPTPMLLGDHLWSRISIMTPPLNEYHEIVAKSYPLLLAYVPTLIRVYEKVTALCHEPTLVTGYKVSIGRSATPRDLLRWCGRIQYVLEAAGLKTGLECLPEDLHLRVFAEAADCFAGPYPDYSARRAIIAAIGEAMQLAPQQVDHFCHGYVPSYRATKDSLTVGYAQLPKKRVSRNMKSRATTSFRPFVATRHTLRLLERVGIATQLSEPVLLVGETGTGKTALVQHLASLLGHRLIVLNLSQQTEAGELLGGFKPVSNRSLVVPMQEEFHDLFVSTFSAGKNPQFLEQLNRYVGKEQWNRVVTLWKEALRLSESALSDPDVAEGSLANREAERPLKRRKIAAPKREKLRAQWAKFKENIYRLEIQSSHEARGFMFKFVEGKLVKAVRNGDWVLLDEINLAPPDTLENIAGLLQPDSTGARAVLLTEAGEVEQVHAHPDFRIFGAMNPATDIGKRDLPFGLRSRFTELYVEGPDRDFDDLLQVIRSWLGQLAENDELAASDIAQFYLEAKQLAKENRLADETNQKPHFSLRTLTRTLSFIVDVAPLYGLRRAMYEGISLSFLTVLNKQSELLLSFLLNKYILRHYRNVKALLKQIPRTPSDGNEYIKFESYWIQKGSYQVEPQPHYIITPFVRRNLLNLVRATSTRRFPVLIQGPTSSGKTSLVDYLAKVTGNKLLRVNNHEHTDLQEYLGGYSSDQDGRLRFQDGILVEALRKGYWIVLDELNLAPTDVLESLNRLLDDNRELMLPETQEVVRPHPQFMLFATQNPPGLYGGRKVLSRAFRNRFIELHFDEIPENELEAILQQRTQVAPSFCTKIVAVYKELLLLRQSDRLFEERNSFITLRDLFRWALRQADDAQQVAINGFMLIGERVRKDEEKFLVKRIIEKVFRLKIDLESLYENSDILTLRSHNVEGDIFNIIWTKAMRRLYLLVSCALQNDEPVLLVGETGSGKTTVCQKLAADRGKVLRIVNAHQNLEAGDLIGAQRPMRNRAAIEQQLTDHLQEVFGKYIHGLISDDDDLQKLLYTYRQLEKKAVDEIPSTLRDRIKDLETKTKTLFEWRDGSLVHSMKNGDYFLLDEISLADDSVLERLNSVLEPQRRLLLAEKGTVDSNVEASQGFQFLATMNPGGDFGKRELSPALRNRFTEIWVPAFSDEDDLLNIVGEKLLPSLRHLAVPIVAFARWFAGTFHTSTSCLSIRDVLAWVDFINRSKLVDPYLSLLHGAALVFIDTLGANPAAMVLTSSNTVDQDRRACIDYLSNLVKNDLFILYFQEVEISLARDYIRVGLFSINRKEVLLPDNNFSLSPSTIKTNAMRIVRAMQLKKPILLEGSPGVGKTALIGALSQVTGNPLTRINLSEHTDLMDLFGSDVPAEAAEGGRFTWRDGPFLEAMQKGEWVLLDEMNLASQSVLEGLNSCFDHRGEVYISELDRSFSRHPEFIVFATQNPHHQGGARKGLPSSFVNRFSVVYIEKFTPEDLMLICKERYPTVCRIELEKLLLFMVAIDDQAVRRGDLGTQGGPWEFNLRDISRWLDLLTSQERLLSAGTAADFFELVISHRFRTPTDKANARLLFSTICGTPNQSRHMFRNLGPTYMQLGLSILPRDCWIQPTLLPSQIDLTARLSETESISICIEKNWPCILVGPAGSGKSDLIKYLASLVGAEILEFAMNPDIDTMDLIGGYDQADPERYARSFAHNLEQGLRRSILQHGINDDIPLESLELLEKLQSMLDSKVDLKLIEDYLGIVSQKWRSLGISAYLEQCKALLKQNDAVETARFEWTDGILVKALEQGAWLILNNANLCTAAVLDRLNGLLEPGGYLSVNEHPDENGLPKIVKPHPKFRIFFTMDPRYGELSRALRNRSVEIFVSTSDKPRALSFGSVSMGTQSESSLARFQYLVELCEENFGSPSFGAIFQAGLFYLPLFDLKSLDVWCAEVVRGLLTLKNENHTIYQMTVNNLLKLKDTDITVSRLLKFYTSISPPVLATDLPADSQPMDPLLNNPVLQLCSAQCSDIDPYWVAYIQDILMEIFGMEEQLSRVEKRSYWTDLSKMSLIEKSASTSVYKSVRKTAFTMVYPFLREVRRSLHHWIIHTSGAPSFREDIQAYLEEMVFYWLALFNMTSVSVLDEATFQVHLSLWEALPAKHSCARNYCKVLHQGVEKALASLKSSCHLSTGLSMERLWEIFRPQIPPTMQLLEKQIHFEELLSSFDTLLWQSRLPLADAVGLRDSVISTIRAVISNVEQSALLEDIETTIRMLEDTSEGVDTWGNAFFQSDFEALCQYHDLSEAAVPETGGMQISPLESSVYFLAKRPANLFAANNPASAVSLQVTTQSRSPAKLLSDLLNYSAYDKDCSMQLSALQGNTSLSILRKISNERAVQLRQLDLLVLEARCLGRNLARSSQALATNQLQAVTAYLLMLVEAVYKAHADVCTEHQLTWIRSVAENLLGIFEKSEQAFPCPRYPAFVATTSDHQYFHELSETYFVPCIYTIYEALSAENKHLHVARAWLMFTLGFLLLYVPDRAFDPALRGFLELELYELKTKRTFEKLEVSRRAELSFSGQTTNQRCQLLETALESGGQQPVPPRVVRPPVSKLNDLQAEFTNLITSVIRTLQKHYTVDGPSLESHDLHVLRANVAQISRRLSVGFRVYEDIVAPVRGILGCLDLGLGLAQAQGMEKDSTPRLASISKLTPFLGGTPDLLLRSFLDDQNHVLGNPSDYRLMYLNWVPVVENAQGSSWRTQQCHKKLMKTFQDFYAEWRILREKDEEKIAASSGLYRYHGSHEIATEDENAEFNELFPAYDQSTESKTSKEPMIDKEHILGQELANLHSAIFLNTGHVAKQILNMIQSSSMKIGNSIESSTSNYSAVDMTEQLLPGVTISLNQMIYHLSTTKTDEANYNIYTDPNIEESQKLAILVRRIRQRFAELRVRWPDHATIQDVLNTCDEVLNYRYSEPVMKFMTKAEKLHGFINEWQLVASKEFSADEFYADLTSLLITWRRLELATWNQLFEIETAKCSNDARSWWYTAYEVIIAVPMSLIEDENDLKQHAVNLLATLQEFFLTTTVGQFSERLQLLAQLKEHAIFIARETQSMGVVVEALQNFINYYSRFDPRVKEALLKGRQSLEREMKDIVLLASWKDININALRESAKRSHHKLFKLVRKYRALLAQSVGAYLTQGPPETAVPEAVAIHWSIVPSPLASDASELCERSIDQWQDKPKRLINVTETVKLICHVGQLSPFSSTVAEALEEFSSNLTTSIKTLQGETPSFLSDENKAAVAHLKTRKRKLFAETLKGIKQMGFKHNLGMNTLAAQESLTMVLATAAVLPATDNLKNVERVDTSFLQVLNMMELVRQSARESSGDLSRAEITRSKGYLEGILHVLLKQRQILAMALQEMSSLGDSCETLRALWGSEKYTLTAVRPEFEERFAELTRCFAWLPYILEVALHILDTQCMLAERGDPKTSIDLEGWRMTIANLASEMRSLPVLPEGIQTDLHSKVQHQGEALLTDLRIELEAWAQQQPEYRYLVKQVLPWTKPVSNYSLLDHERSAANGHPTTSVEHVDSQVSQICDTIFSAIQKMQETVRRGPISSENPDWLFQHGENLRHAISDLHAPQIISQIRNAVSELRLIGSDNRDGLQIACARMAVALPIIQEYSNIYYQVVRCYAELHQSTCRLAYILTRAFVQLASQGFCSPPEKSAAEDGKNETVEGGTGLGEGQGAEDISKDIGPDEDLTDIAQEPNENQGKEEMQHEQDAVEMAEDIDGQLENASDAEDQGDASSGEENEEKEIDEGVGEVDDLDPTAVDEKLWDAGGEGADKEQKGDKTNGKQVKDEQVAADDQKDRVERDDDEEVGSPDYGIDEGEQVVHEEPNETDPCTQKEEALDLPEDMDLDGDKKSQISEDVDGDLDGLSDLVDEQDGPLGEDEPQEGGPENHGAQTELENENESGGAEDAEEKGESDETSVTHDPDLNAEDTQDIVLQDHPEDATADPENAAPSDARGAGALQPQEETDQGQPSSRDAQPVEATSEQTEKRDQAMTAEDQQPGVQGSSYDRSNQEQSQPIPTSAQNEAFRKLGDMLERWHRQQKQISDASEERTNADKEKMQGMEVADFEHLRDEDDAADTQALGAASQEQAHGVDESMAIDFDAKQESSSFIPESPAEDAEAEDIDRMDVDQQAFKPDDVSQPDKLATPRAFIGERTLQAHEFQSPQTPVQVEEKDVQQVDSHLSNIHLSSFDPSALSTYDLTTARALWTHYENTTRPLPLILTEQLRLILSPTQKSKMRGDFRTGKRLNIKRIIPYIASQYKRDKIWMRRAVPSKRNYQIMLAVDDSKSMAEHGAGQLAFETLVMVAKSLSMLEAGQLCVVAFGADVKVAHAFDTPFFSDAGPGIFQCFGFQQTKTDVRALLSRSLELFQSARLAASSSASNTAADLWQLQLIISDGICEDHDSIRRLVRQAQEQRVMIVFIIVDNLNNKSNSANANATGSSGSSSILDMTQARFEKDDGDLERGGASGGGGGMKLKIQRYLDTFPFQFYLVVGDVKDLPGVLATALRQWFREVVDAAG